MSASQYVTILNHFLNDLLCSNKRKEIYTKPGVLMKIMNHKSLIIQNILIRNYMLRIFPTFLMEISGKKKKEITFCSVTVVEP